MMETHLVFVIGESMFAETLAQMLACCPDLRVCGSAPTYQAARSQILADQPDVILVASVHSSPNASLTRFISQHPGTTLIYADLCTNFIQVITSQSIIMRSFGDLLSVLGSLPKTQA
jgi:hypothetical protein